MQTNQPEFKVGDTVTFFPYETPLEAKVSKVIPNKFGDGKCYYDIRGKGVVSSCSGESIKESASFKPMSEEEMKKTTKFKKFYFGGSK